MNSWDLEELDKVGAGLKTCENVVPNGARGDHWRNPLQENSPLGDPKVELSIQNRHLASESPGGNTHTNTSSINRLRFRFRFRDLET